MTADDATGLRQQIAEAIHAEEICGCDLMGGDDCWHTARAFLTAADAVVALLNLTEDQQTIPRWGDCYACATPNDVCRPPDAFGWNPCCGGCQHIRFDPSSRFVTPWLPSTPPPEAS